MERKFSRGLILMLLWRLCAVDTVPTSVKLFALGREIVNIWTHSKNYSMMKCREVSRSLCFAHINVGKSKRI